MLLITVIVYLEGLVLNFLAPQALYQEITLFSAICKSLYTWDRTIETVLSRDPLYLVLIWGKIVMYQRVELGEVI